FSSFERRLQKRLGLFFGKAIDKDFAAFDAKPALAVRLNGPRVDAVLLRQNPGRKRFLRVLREDRNDGLNDDGTLVAVLVDEMHRAAGKSHAVLHRSSLNMEPGEGRSEERRVGKGGTRQGGRSVG